MVYGRVYSLRTHQSPNIYIGSTTQILCKRMSDHRKDYKRFLNTSAEYVSSYEIIRYEDAYIELIFEGEFESVNALRKKEGEYQREMDCVNKNIAGRTAEEYREDNKEKIAQHSHEYYEKNKERKLEYALQYRENHKEEMKPYLKQWYEMNKEKVKKQKQKKVNCECGSSICISDIRKHERTERHQNFMLFR